MRNIKNGPWCWQEKKVMRAIRGHFEGKRRTTCIAIYQSLTELASNNSSDVFPAFNAQIAELSSKSISTVKIYCRELVKLGLLRKRPRKKNKKINLANEWGLLSPSVNNDYPTLGRNSSTSSGKNKPPLLEKTLLENIYKKREGACKNAKQALWFPANSDNEI